MGQNLCWPELLIILNVFVYGDIYILKTCCQEEYVEIAENKYKGD